MSLPPCGPALPPHPSHHGRRRRSGHGGGLRRPDPCLPSPCPCRCRCRGARTRGRPCPCRGPPPCPLSPSRRPLRCHGRSVGLRSQRRSRCVRGPSSPGCGARCPPGASWCAAPALHWPASPPPPAPSDAAPPWLSCTPPAPPRPHPHPCPRPPLLPHPPHRSDGGHAHHGPAHCDGHGTRSGASRSATGAGRSSARGRGGAGGGRLGLPTPRGGPVRTLPHCRTHARRTLLPLLFPPLCTPLHLLPLHLPPYRSGLPACPLLPPLPPAPSVSPLLRRWCRPRTRWAASNPSPPRRRWPTPRHASEWRSCCSPSSTSPRPLCPPRSPQSSAGPPPTPPAEAAHPPPHPTPVHHAHRRCPDGRDCPCREGRRRVWCGRARGRGRVRRGGGRARCGGVGGGGRRSRGRSGRKMKRWDGGGRRRGRRRRMGRGGGGGGRVGGGGWAVSWSEGNSSFDANPNPALPPLIPPPPSLDPPPPPYPPSEAEPPTGDPPVLECSEKGTPAPAGGEADRPCKGGEAEDEAGDCCCPPCPIPPPPAPPPPAPPPPSVPLTFFQPPPPCGMSGRVGSNPLFSFFRLGKLTGRGAVTLVTTLPRPRPRTTTPVTALEGDGLNDLARLKEVTFLGTEEEGEEEEEEGWGWERTEEGGEGVGVVEEGDGEGLVGVGGLRVGWRGEEEGSRDDEDGEVEGVELSVTCGCAVSRVSWLVDAAGDDDGESCAGVDVGSGVVLLLLPVCVASACARWAWRSS